jgi:hypothetical protein
MRDPAMGTTTFVLIPLFEPSRASVLAKPTRASLKAE